MTEAFRFVKIFDYLVRIKFALMITVVYPGKIVYYSRKEQSKREQ